MGQVESQVVTEFQGLLAGPRRPLHTDRRPLDTPRELINFLVDDFGHLWMPKAPDHTEGQVGGAGNERISQIVWSVVEFTKLAQRGNKLYASARGASHAPEDETQEWNWVEIISDLGSDHPVWVTSFGYADPEMDDRIYVGNIDNTWRIEYDGGESWTVTNPPLSGFHGWASFHHLGRRWVARDSQLAYFSAINDPESFSDEDYVNVGGGSTGKDASTFPGEITGFFFWENSLGIMCAGSMWQLSGTTVDTFQLRKWPHDVGTQGRTDLHYHEVKQGMAFLGGERDGAMGVYVFMGSRPQKISHGIEEFFQKWQAEYTFAPATEAELYVKVREEIGRYANATRHRNYYVLSFAPADEDRQVYAYNLNRSAWSTFDGWGDGPSLTVLHDYYHPQRLNIGHETGTVYSSTEPMARFPGRPAKVTLGWSDEERTSGLVRFLGVKLRGWRSGSGYEPTITVEAKTDIGGQEQRGPFVLPNNVFESFVVPLNIRGAALELEITIQPDDDSDQVLIEGLELITSRKGEKLSRS